MIECSSSVNCPHSGVVDPVSDRPNQIDPQLRPSVCRMQLLGQSRSRDRRSRPDSGWINTPEHGSKLCHEAEGLSSPARRSWRLRLARNTYHWRCGFRAAKIARLPIGQDRSGSASDRCMASDEPKWELFDGVPVLQDHEKWVHARHGKRPPRKKSISMSRRFHLASSAHALTRRHGGSRAPHGRGTRPRAS